MEARLRAVLDTAQESVLAVDCEGRIALFNAACERLFGYRAAEVIGRHVDELISPSAPGPEIPKQRSRSPGLVDIGMHAATGRHKDGTQFPLELSIGSPVWAGADLLVGIIHDLTERVRTEDELRESAEQVRAVVDTAVDGVILIDMRGNIVMFNPACERLFGYSANELIGQNVKVLMPAPFRAEHDGYLANYHKTGERKIIGIGREVVGRRKDGTTFPMDLSVGEARHRGEPLFVGIIRDITDRKRTENELRETAEQLRAVVDTAVDGVILIDMRGNIVMFNPACERLFGYAREELLGHNVKVLMPAPFHEEHDGYLANYHTTGERKIIGIGREVMGRRKDGTTFPMDLSVGEARHRGEPLFVGIIRDITDRKREEAQREEFISQLTQSNEERGYFAHIASHDLKQSLRMVSAFCGLLQQRYADRLDDRGREFLSLATSAAQQMTDLLSDMLEYGRLTTDEARFSWFDSGESVRHVLETLSEPIKISGAVVTQDSLPTVYANPVRFTRLLENLVGNAIKYVAPGVRPRVHLSAQITQDEWIFTVRDNGIGISPEYRRQIFEPFKRLHTSSQYPGTGLGLSICKRIVEGFGGEMGIEENADGGSTFTFTMKQRDAP